MNPRATAARILTQVIHEQRSLTQLLAELSSRQPEISLVKALCYGVLRWYFKLDFLLQPFLAKPIKAKDADINVLLLIGLYQILYLKTPAHVAVMQTVAAARDLKKPWATRLINGVLRAFLRAQKDKPDNSAEPSLVAEFSHPQWFIAAVQTAWPQDWQSILIANNQHPPLCLRVNLLQISVEQYLDNLAERQITALAVPQIPAALILETPQDVTQLPGYHAGQFSVQDAAAQLAAQWLDLAPGQRVLDACAAPGGKTLHLLEKQPDLAEIVALDIQASRLKKAQENWQRLRLPNVIRWITADAMKTDAWWDRKPFERILLDAPCSATGVIRRHPDIKVLRKLEDITKLAAQQTLLLEALWPLLSMNGLLLYTTCSILPEENEQVILQFLLRHPEARERKLPDISATQTQVGRQILTGFNHMDGFYYAALERVG